MLRYNHFAGNQRLVPSPRLPLSSWISLLSPHLSLFTTARTSSPLSTSSTRMQPFTFAVPPLIVDMHPMLYLPVPRVTPVLRAIILQVVRDNPWSGLLDPPNDIQRIICIMVAGNKCTSRFQTFRSAWFSPHCFRDIGNRKEC